MSDEKEMVPRIIIRTERTAEQFNLEDVIDATLAHARRAQESAQSAYDMHTSEANDAAREVMEWQKAIDAITTQKSMIVGK